MVRINNLTRHTHTLADSLTFSLIGQLGRRSSPLSATDLAPPLPLACYLSSLLACSLTCLLAGGFVSKKVATL